MKLGLHNHLCFQFYVASRLIIQTYNEEFEALGLTHLKYLVLMALSENGDLTVNELGEILHLDSGTLSPLLKSLKASGLISRKRRTSDARQVVNHLNCKGQEISQRAYKIVYSLFKETELSEEAFFKLLNETDDFVKRVKKILNNRKTKESPWQTNYSASAQSLLA